MPDETEQELLERAQSDAALVRRSGDEHPDEVVAVRIDVEVPGRVLVLLSGDDSHHHEDVLRRLVGRPDRLEVRRSPWSASYLQEILAEVEELAGISERGVFRRWGLGWGTVTVGLRSDQEARAIQLHDRFGDAVSLTVGQFAFPAGRPLTWSERFQAAAMAAGLVTLSPVEVVLIPGLEVRMELLPPEVGVGQDGHGVVIIRNVGLVRQELETGQPLVGTVLDAQSGEIVGGGTMFIAGTGLIVRLEPGEEASIALSFLTASGRPGLGYSLPPGRYLVRAEVPIHDLGPELEGARRVLQVPSAQLSIV